MAVKYEDFKKEQNKVIKELKPDEIAFITRIENWIDNEIKNHLDSFTDEIKIGLEIPSFKFNPFSKQRTTFEDAARKRMSNELNDRYIKAGWDVDIKIDNSGGMNEQDYWIISKPVPRKRGGMICG